MTDPIADMLTRIRNATIARHPRVDVPFSTLKAEIARILAREGYVEGSRVVDEPASDGVSAPRKLIRIALKYGPHGERVITGVERVSRPGRRVYSRRDTMPVVLGGLGTAILTTSRGVMTERDAERAGVGGEVLCSIW